MNKYQEALDRIINDDYDFPNDYYGEDRATAMERDEETLQELVDKEELKKPIKRYYTDKYGNNGKIQRVDILCPCCKSYFVNGVRKSIGIFKSREKNFIDSVKHTKYCMFCGNRIDWSDEE